jgi:hypothetical protein
MEGKGQLAVPAENATDMVWASANAASLLHVTAQNRNTPPPQQSVIELIREGALQSILIRGLNSEPR